MNAFLTVKAFHIIFVVSWFCGLFYIVRLFIYHTEALGKENPEKEILTREYTRIERLLWKIITTPAMFGTVLTGSLMIWLNPTYLEQSWMMVKLSMVLVLLVYHFICQKLRVKLMTNQTLLTSFQLRLWNEVATILLVMIVFIVVQKHAMNWIYGTFFFIAFALAIMFTVRLVKIYRNRKA